MRMRLMLYAVGILSLGTAITLIATASQTTAIAVDQDLDSKWRTAYDILIRPAGARSHIEEQYGLVEANHLSSIWGGITFEQYEAIKSIPNVEVAAPIAMLGYNIAIASGDEIMLPSDPGVYILEEKVKVDSGASLSTSAEYPKRVYYYFTQDPHTLPLFDPNLPYFVGNLIVDNPGETVRGYVLFPLFLAGIDPTQEAALVALDQALLEGQYLTGNETLTPRSTAEFIDGFEVPESQINMPILINGSTYVRLTHQTELNRVIFPTETTSPDDILARGGIDYLDNLPSKSLATVEMAGHTMYQHMIEAITAPSPAMRFGGWATYSTPSALVYHETEPPFEQENPVLELRLPDNPGDENRPNYRVSSQADYNAYFTWDIKGIFDIERIPKPADVNRVPLETYFPPIAILRYDEEGQPVEPRTLHPTLNPAGYIQSPPMLLTTLEASRELRGEAAISAIRVRVTLEGCPGDYLTCPVTSQNQRKIETIASEIAHQTGLDVDIMVGSSPTRVLVKVPEIGYVEEQWIQKTVTQVYEEKVQTGHLLLLSALLGIGGLFSLDLSWAEVVARRRTIALQKALGWRSATVFRQVLGQIVFVAGIAGMLGSLLAWGISMLLKWKQPSSPLLFGMPLLVMALSALGCIYPAWLAGCVAPMVGLRQANIRYPRHTSLRPPVRRLLPYAWQGISRRWSRTALGGLTAALSAALLVLMLAVTVDRHGTMSGTLLGEFILVHIQGYHYAIVGIGLGLAALSLANSLLAGVLERRREIGVLKAVGWRTTAVAQLFLVEGALITALGGLVGTFLGLTVFVALYKTMSLSLGWIGLAGVVVPVVVGLLAAIYPARAAARVPPAEVVRYE